MNSFLLNRQLGSIGQQTFARAQNNRLFRALDRAPNIQVSRRKSDDSDDDRVNPIRDLAHPSGVSSIAIDRFEGRYLISGGADSSLAIWDLESGAPSSADATTYISPLNAVTRTASEGVLGITQVSFYPFDSLALLTSGYDHTLKLFASETLTTAASFDLDSVVYSHATSTVASHLLVACATQHPAVRLVDLRSGASTHSLAGHSGAVLTVGWHPKHEHILASGATDGTIRLWDVRRSASSLGVLDLEDSVGVAGYDGTGTGARRRDRGRAHSGAANGIVWTADGRFLVSVGHDERMRVWDMATGANTLANFGPGLKNAHTTSLLPLVVPSHLSELGKHAICYPNPREILSFDMHSGTLLGRMRVVALPGSQSTDMSGRNPRTRTTAVAWRTHHVEMYSAHGDGTIRCWQPRTWEDSITEEDELRDDAANRRSSDRKRKRDEFDEMVRNLTEKQVTFS